MCFSLNKLSSELFFQPTEEEPKVTTALGSLQNTPRIKLNRWIANMRQAIKNYQKTAAAVAELIKQIDETLRTPLEQYLAGIELIHSPEGLAAIDAEIQLVVQTLEVLKDPKLGQLVFGDRMKPELLDLLLQSRILELRDAGQITIHEAALTAILDQLSAGRSINVDDYLGIVEMKEAAANDTVLHRSALNSKGFAELPGFSDHRDELRSKSEGFGDRYISRQVPPAIVTKDIRPAIRAMDLIPPLLRPLKVDSRKIPGRPRLESGVSGGIVRATRPGELVAVPQSADDWFPVPLIPLLPSFSPGVRWLHGSPHAAPLFLRFLVRLPASFILMFSGTGSLSNFRDSSRAEGLI